MESRVYIANRTFIKIPNEEVKEEYSGKLEEYFYDNYKLDEGRIRNCSDFFNRVDKRAKSDDVSLFKRVENLQQDLQGLMKLFKKHSGKELLTSEAILDHLAFFVVARLKYFLVDNKFHNKRKDEKKRDNTARLNLYLTKGNHGVILELMYTKAKSLTGLQHILDNQYYNVYKTKKFINNKIIYVLFVGISVDDKAELSVSYLANSRNISNAVTVP